MPSYFGTMGMAGISRQDVQQTLIHDKTLQMNITRTEIDLQNCPAPTMASSDRTATFEGVAVDPSAAMNEAGANIEQANSNSNEPAQAQVHGDLKGWPYIHAMNANESNPMIYREHRNDRKEDLVFHEEKLHVVKENLIAIDHEIASIEHELATTPPTTGSTASSSAGSCFTGIRQTLAENDDQTERDPRYKRLSELRKERDTYREQRSSLLAKQGNIVMMLKEFASWKRVSKEVARRTAQSIIRLGCLPEQEGAWLHVEDDFVQDPTVTLSFEPEFLMDDKSYLARLVRWSCKVRGEDNVGNGVDMPLSMNLLGRLALGLQALSFGSILLVPAAIILETGIVGNQALGVVAVGGIIVAVVGARLPASLAKPFAMFCAYMAVLMPLVLGSTAVRDNIMTLQDVSNCVL